MQAKTNCYPISVIVPTYNRSALLEHTLRSLVLQETDPCAFEVIVADDGSSDDTPAIIKKYASQLNLKYVFQEDKGYRPASARNMGIRAAEGALCVFIDSGIIANRNCLEVHLRFHEANGERAAAIGYIYGLGSVDEAEEKLLKKFEPENPVSLMEHISGQQEYADVREEHFKLHNDSIHTLPAPWFFFWSGHIAVSRSALLEVGMFDEGYDGKWGIEDNDLGFRLHQAGIQIHLLRHAECIHYPHNTFKPGKEQEGRQNCIYFHNKYQTRETGLFLRHFASTEFVDINKLSMEMQAAVTGDV